MTRKKIFIFSGILAVFLVLSVFAVKLADGTLMPHQQVTPSVTVPDDVKVKFPRPELVQPKISVDAKAKLPRNPKPEVKTTPAPVVDPVPAPIVETREYLLPLRPIQEQPPYAIVPEAAPAQRQTYPSKPPVSIVTENRSVPLRPPVLPRPRPVPPQVVVEPVAPPTAPVVVVPEPIIPELPELPIDPEPLPELELPIEPYTIEVGTK